MKAKSICKAWWVVGYFTWNCAELDFRFETCWLIWYFLGAKQKLSVAIAYLFGWGRNQKSASCEQHWFLHGWKTLGQNNNACRTKIPNKTKSLRAIQMFWKFTHVAPLHLCLVLMRCGPWFMVTFGDVLQDITLFLGWFTPRTVKPCPVLDTKNHKQSRFWIEQIRKFFTRNECPKYLTSPATWVERSVFFPKFTIYLKEISRNGDGRGADMSWMQTNGIVRWLFCSIRKTT
jgi:hypothetical protein